MGMDLSGAGGEFFWNFFSWPRLLQIAEEYGWEPAGTLPPEYMEMPEEGQWSGDYTSNDQQTVTAEDAWQLAEALERALDDIPEEDVLAPYRTETGMIQLTPDTPEIDDLDWFCGPKHKDHIRKFLQFCRAGSFQIS
jgi:hypothetical protein